MEILYCSRCNRQVVSGGVQDGRYFMVGDDVVCAKCHQKPPEAQPGGHISVLPLEERAAAVEARPPSSAVPHARTATTRLMPAAQDRPEPTGSSRRQAAGSGGATVRIVLAVIVAVALLGCVAAILLKKRQATSGGPPAVPVNPGNPGTAWVPDLRRGLVAHWTFDEGSGAVARDSSGAGRDARLLVGTKRVPGWSGSALEFDGRRGGAVAEGVAVNTAPGAMNTVAFWMKWTGRGNQMPFCWEGAYDLYANQDSFGINTGEGGNLLGTAVQGWAGKWVHVAAVFPNAVPGPANSRLYIDGQAREISFRYGRATQVRQASPGLRLSGTLKEGKYPFSGIIDEVRIYSRELSAGEVAELFRGAAGSGAR